MRAFGLRRLRRLKKLLLLNGCDGTSGKLTENNSDGQEDDERPPTSEGRPAPVRHRSEDRGAEEPDERRQAPDQGHVLV